jgi:hypothetical protein
MAACCQQPENLKALPQTRTDLIIRVCAVCGRRHFEVTMEPGRIGLKTT